ncbi:PIWL1 protein, partial [Rhinopomastus cyanomelas]|nr:PIWL1 protein [Rhinopomastus cyanomelas]
MAVRARARARGKPPGQETGIPAVGAAAIQPAQQRQQPYARGRHRDPQNVPQQQIEKKPEGLQLSVGFQSLCIGDRGGHRKDYHDLGVNTRQAMEHVQESKTGFSGNVIKLCANFFRLTSRPQWALYQYHVGYSPEMEARRLRTALLLHHDKLIGKSYAFDGSVLFLPRRLANKVTEVFSKTRNGENVKITITLTNELPPTSPTCLHFYNIIFRRLLKMLNFQQIGRHYYNPEDPINIPNHRMMIWPGFATSILQYEESIMLCVDVSHKVLRNETVLEYMYDLCRQVEERRIKEICAKELLGVIVLTKYNNRTYRIDDIDWDANPQCTFLKADGSEISYIDYYKKQYNLDIHDLNQPVLITQRKRRRENFTSGPIALIPELCFLTGLTEKMRSDFYTMRDLAVHTRLPPEQRQHEIGKLIDSIQRDDNVQDQLQSWGLGFDSQLLSFNGRVAQRERIFQSGNVFDYNPQFADWSRETRGVPLSCAKPLDNWLLIYTRRNYGSANSLLQSLFKVTPSMGIRMNKATMLEVDDRVEAYLRALRQSITPDTNIVFCILSSSQKVKYDAIKKYLCTDCPIPSQCVLARTLSKPQTLLAVATKIALQMNCKMGGELWTVEIPLKHVMIVGIDCYHDTSSGKRSIAGFVASLNQTMSRWFSRCVLQDHGQELVDGLKVCFQTALRDWYKYNKYLPSRIIVYRDGVGDGQLSALVSYEVPQILDCLKSIGQDYSPRLAVIVVKKRLNTRFFVQRAGEFKNPPPGTIVDVEITRPEWYDFYIVSQAVRNGCVSPTHYNVIYDTSKLKPDHMQRLTYKLCHLYYNWQGVIRVPAPCQYAHKLAFLVGQSIHKEPNLLLSDKLFYL